MLSPAPVTVTVATSMEVTTTVDVLVEQLVEGEAASTGVAEGFTVSTAATVVIASRPSVLEAGRGTTVMVRAAEEPASDGLLSVLLSRGKGPPVGMVRPMPVPVPVPWW